ncbi:cation:proton antiporter [Vagococcus martis]
MDILLTLGLIILFTKIADSIAMKFGLPSVVGSLIVGILVGPSVFNIIQNNASIELLSHLGVILLMFIAGVESDLKILKKYFKPSLITGLLGVLIPFAVFFFASRSFNYSQDTSMFIGLIFGATSLSIAIQVLKELNFIQTKEGSIIIGSSILDDIIVVILLNLVLNLVNPNTTTADVLPFLFKNVLFFLFIYIFGKYILPIILKGLSYFIVPERDVAFSLIMVFLLSFLADWIGMSDIIGAFFAGILISQTPFAEYVERKVTSITSALFAPVFFVSIGLKLVLDGLGENMLLIIVFSVLAIFTKFIGGFLGGKIEKFDNNSSAIIGASLISRGEMALILIALGLEKGFIDQGMYASLVLVIIFTTVIAPILLKWAISLGDKSKAELDDPVNES